MDQEYVSLERLVADRLSCRKKQFSRIYGVRDNAGLPCNALYFLKNRLVSAAKRPGGRRVVFAVVR